MDAIPEVIVICGMMGVGKTRLARIIEKQGYEYIDFDGVYHEVVQQGDGLPHVAPMLAWLAAFMNPAANYVIDGWFSWHADWWRDLQDTSIGRLHDRVPHTISLVLLTADNKDTLDRYATKHNNGQYVNAYVQTYGERFKRLLERVGGAFG